MQASPALLDLEMPTDGKIRAARGVEIAATLLAVDHCTAAGATAGHE